LYIRLIEFNSVQPVSLDIDNLTTLFYLVALLEGQLKEPLWLVQDDIAAVEGENPQETRLQQGDEHSLQQYCGDQISTAHMQGLRKKLDEKRQEAGDYGKVSLAELVRAMMVTAQVPTVRRREGPEQLHECVIYE
jgi:hypothetical protein